MDTGQTKIEKTKNNYLIIQFFSVLSRVVLHQIFYSWGHPVEQFYWMSSRFYATANRNSTGRPVEIFIAILRHLKQTYKIQLDVQ